MVGLIVVSLFFFTSDVLAADGFAEGVTGGAGGDTVTVDSNAAGFEYYARRDEAYIIEVSGIIDLDTDYVGGKVNIKSNKTIRGTDANATIVGNLAFQNGASNVIIERLNITTPDDYGEGDGITVKYATDIFITKCTVYNCDDGCIDITRESNDITVSWCKFYYSSPVSHRYVNLIGGDDDHTGDMGKLHITFHHNWYYSYCDQRMPSVRYGRLHIYNNYYDCPGNSYCVVARLYSECLIESNYFDHVDNPYYIYVTTGTPGKIEEGIDNIFESCGGYTDPGDDDVFDPPYSYTLNDANDVPDIVQAYAGADNPEPPHWLVTLYGDFDINGVVDENDLETFADYWLQTSDIDDADYFDNGRVDGREFALFAQNWREPSEP